MRKVHVTMKSIRQDYKKVFRAGYCDLQDIFKYREPQFYNAGVYGWNCDVYVDYGRDIAITTGYRNMAGRSIPHELIRKYSDIAKEIESGYCWKVPWDEIREKLDKNAENFLKELDEI